MCEGEFRSFTRWWRWPRARAHMTTLSTVLICAKTGLKLIPVFWTIPSKIVFVVSLCYFFLCVTNNPNLILFKNCPNCCFCLLFMYVVCCLLFVVCCLLFVVVVCCLLLLLLLLFVFLLLLHFFCFIYCWLFRRSGNKGALIRIKHPLSVSSMDFFANRVTWNQLTVLDVVSVVRVCVSVCVCVGCWVFVHVCMYVCACVCACVCVCVCALVCVMC